jgi:acyl-coenzyme A synthetase/AMP-(fatty) acid ligase
MTPDHPWIATPHLRPDYRGPTGHAYVPFPDPAASIPMIAMLEGVARRTPDAVAVDSTGACLSYRDLWQAVRGLQSKIESAAPTEGPAAILLPAGVGYVLAVFAALAAKRVALLLDQGSPRHRSAATALAAGVKLMLVRPGLDSRIAWGDIVSIPVADDALDQTAPVDASWPLPLALDEPAFILCTSGSTGLPKPIVHSQRTMLHWVRTVSDAMHLTADDQVLSVSPPSTLGGFVALLACSLTGASMYMLDVRPTGFHDFLQVVATRPITILRAAPSFIRALARVPGAVAAMMRLRLVQLYGEPLLKADLVELRKILAPDCLIRSTYGSTEASGLSWFAGEPDDFDPRLSATGILMPDTSALIVDETGRPCAPGAAGELLIRSRYNALGEWKNGKVAAGMFERDPCDDSVRIYRTGDLARFHSEGVFVVLGRKDRMLKINGQRVEPAEVELALRRFPEIVEAEVLPYTREQTTRLIAFVVPNPDAEPGLAERLDTHLRNVLPGHMIPSRIHLLPAIPRLPSGKVESRELLSRVGE